MSELAFIAAYHRESEAQIRWCLTHLRAAYPDVAVVLQADGVQRPEIQELAREFRVEHRAGQQLKRIQQGLAWWYRFFCTARMLDADYTFKLDLDARIWRPFKFLPLLDLFGHELTLHSASDRHINGGCQGFSRAFVQTFLDSRCWTHLRWRHQSSWGVSRAVWSWYQHQRPDYFSTDYSIMAVAKQLQRTWGHWPEVLGYGPVPADQEQTHVYAVTHPHKIAEAT